MGANDYYLEIKNKSPLTIEGRAKEVKESDIRIDLDGGNQRKVTFYHLALGHAETYLMAARHFDDIAREYQFDAADKYKYWRKIMDGDHASQDTWDSIISGVARTNNNFNNACASLLETFIDPRDYQHFLQYLTLYGNLQV